MKPLLAITTQTIRSGIRSRVFLVLFIIVLLAVIGLPFLVTGDGTAAGEIKISFSYTLGVVLFLISTSTVWLASSMIAKEIEAYNMHLVFCKPIAPWKVWVGKWLGIFSMNSLIYIIATLVLLGIMSIKVKNINLSEKEKNDAIVAVQSSYNLEEWKKFDATKRGAIFDEAIANLKKNLLSAKRVVPVTQPDFKKAAADTYQKNLKNKLYDDNHQPAREKATIFLQLKAKYSTIDTKVQKSRYCYFQNIIKPPKGKSLKLRYRFYSESTSQSKQKIIIGQWAAIDQKKRQAFFLPVHSQQIMSGCFHTIDIPPEYIYENSDGQNSLALTLVIKDARGLPLIFKYTDGPSILIDDASFLSNYLRSAILSICQLAFLAALGCAVGGMFSTPVAIFAGLSYLFAGFLVQATLGGIEINSLGELKLETLHEQFAWLLSNILVSIKDFDSISDLAKGQLIEWIRILKTLIVMVLLRGGLIATLGIWIISRRELGTVVRK